MIIRGLIAEKLSALFLRSIHHNLQSWILCIPTAPCGFYTLRLGGAQGFPVVIRIQLAPYGSSIVNGQAIEILWVLYIQL